jgi:hypothetical protein
VISADGNVVAFHSRSDNVHPLDTDRASDIFARNLLTNTTYLVSVSSDGTAGGNDDSDEPIISADGRVVAFQSAATNLHPLDTNTRYDILARNLETETTYLVSINSAGTGTLGFTALDPVISANGNVVAFRRLEGGIYARNLVAGTNYVVSIDPTGTFTADANGHVISEDGSVVAFHSNSSLHPLDANGWSDVYARNIATSTTYLVSVNAAGTGGDDNSHDPAVSADGSVIAFRSSASNLHSLKTGRTYDDVFVRNLVSGTTFLISVDSGGTGSGNEDARAPLISADGSIVAFDSDASNLVDADYNSSSDVFAGTIPIVPVLLGDYNGNNVVDAADYIVWRITLGTTGMPAYSGADGDGDATIDQDDYDVWRAHFGQTAPASSAGNSAALSSVKESVRQTDELAVPARSNPAPAEANTVPVPSARFDVLEMPSRRQESAPRSRRAIDHDRWQESGSDDLLMLAIDRVSRDLRQDFLESCPGGKYDQPANDDDGLESDEPFAMALAEWP